ncbi:MAG: M20/M25/M40 family metallo-hydrolase [Candidatus Marinimicrobia bacterium]|jgi:hypothetical protein|nr:M20/M25/M40 family metallo-hydrolase [Candidatus Neomarinimicrobiota bacterium]MBT3618049.1 M20/M25/M40 family metallo-hydrolase [Candidatus Neomarinimicrobiota bacterium]MBT3828494.1 M20/M25/M40 family metallo-hydrolase [Candidatus Neomarinimicrobiota bacterium]MBT3998035.1 M20/M25/M40 family metallo-hydrolase [Candidatus Neomarinimicrobiota bacterium]MBT4280261.1 M20/M25/M40 family metallo-hydrolase [Candidatus Neomarinimicrobiota bacterium]
MFRIKSFIFFSFAVLIQFYCAGPSLAITSNELESHVQFLASDNLEGRFPGTDGGMLAANYVKNKFIKSGLTLLGEAGFQYFEVTTDVSLGESNSMQIGESSYEVEKDFIPISYSQSSSLQAPVTFVGYGFDFNTDSLSRNDYSNMDVSGKWVLILRGSPDGNNPHGEYNAYSSIRQKITVAKDHQAAGVIFVSGVEFDEKDELIPMQYEQGSSAISLPIIHVRRHLVDSVLKESHKTIASLEVELNSDENIINAIEVNQLVSVTTDVVYTNVQTQNVIGFLPGTDELLQDEYIVLGAHYDHLGYGGHHSGSRRPDENEIHNGADDNASGTSVLIELAEKFSKEKLNKRSVIFIAFGSEEMGLLGSKYFVKSNLIDKSKIQIMINMDMVGRLDETEQKISISGTQTAIDLEKSLEEILKSQHIQHSFSPEGYGPSDHSSFYVNDVPVLFFFTGSHSDYHTPTDDADKINYIGMQSVLELVFSVAIQYATMNDRFVFQEAGPKKREERQRFKVSLGIMPDYTYSETKGLRIDAILKDKPAEKGGLLDGDIIIEMNGKSVDDIYEYMQRLTEIKQGDEIDVKVLRGKHEIIQKVPF